MSWFWVRARSAHWQGHAPAVAGGAVIALGPARDQLPADHPLRRGWYLSTMEGLGLDGEREATDDELAATRAAMEGAARRLRGLVERPALQSHAHPFIAWAEELERWSALLAA